MNLGPHLLALAVASYPVSDRTSSRVLPDKMIFNRYRTTVAYPAIFFGGGGSTNSVEDRENEDLGAAAP